MFSKFHNQCVTLHGYSSGLLLFSGFVFVLFLFFVFCLFLFLFRFCFALFLFFFFFVFFVSFRFPRHVCFLFKIIIFQNQ